MVLLSSPIVSLDDVKIHMPVRDGNADFDDKLTAFIRVATTQIENATKRSFTLQARTELFNSPETSRLVYNFAGSDTGLIPDVNAGLARRVRETILMLDVFPVDTALNVDVFYDPNRKFPANTEIDEDAYFVDGDAGRILLRFPMARGIQFIKVTYTGGHVVADSTLSASAPEDLKLACILQTIYLFKKSNPDNVGARKDRKQGKVNEAQFTRSSGLTPEAASLLVPFVKLLKGNG